MKEIIFNIRNNREHSLKARKYSDFINKLRVELFNSVANDTNLHIEYVKKKILGI